MKQRVKAEVRPRALQGRQDGTVSDRWVTSENCPLHQDLEGGGPAREETPGEKRTVRQAVLGGPRGEEGQREDGKPSGHLAMSPAPDTCAPRGPAAQPLEKHEFLPCYIQ